MKVLVVSRAYFPAIRYGGPVTWWRTMCAELAGRGHDVRVVCTDMASEGQRGERLALSELVLDEVHVRYYRTQLRYRWEGVSLRALAELPQLVGQVDAVMVGGTRHYLGTLAMAAARHYSVPYLVIPEGSIPARSHNILGKHIVDSSLTRHELAAAARLIAKSPLEAGDLASWGMKSSQVVVSPPWAGAPELVDVSRRVLRAALGLPTDAAILLWVGRIHTVKGLSILLEALTDRRLRDTVLLIAGDGTDEQLSTRLHERARQPDLAERVRFLGWVDSRRRSELFALADLFVFPSLHENFGNAAAEALRGGLPVVVSSKCGIASLIEGRAGLVCAPEMGALADALYSAVGQPKEIERLRLGASDLAAELGPSRAAAWLEELLVTVSAETRKFGYIRRTPP
ncbi:MAG: glycosyltransferase [Acidimicrobiales bacterium]